MTAQGREGMVVKHLNFIAEGKRGITQPAMKCRGAEYLRIIYGPEYLLPENLERLRSVRQRLHDDLMGTLAWVRELVSMIHLAKFTGAPASRAVELVAQIATAVEGLSEVTHWTDDIAVAAK
jgi:hypothetical protein